MEEKDNVFREQIEMAIKRAKNPKGAANLLALLFPKIEKILKTYVPDSMDDRERKRARRISESEFAPSYFGLDPQPLLWSRSELESIVNADDPSSLLADAQRRIELAPESDRARLRRILLDSLNGAFDEARPFKSNWLKAFVDASPYFIRNVDEKPEFFGFNNLQRMRWIILSGVERLDTQERYEIFHAAIANAKDLSLLSDVVRTYTQDSHLEEKKNENAKRDYFGAHGEELRQQLLNRIKQLANSGDLWSQAEPGSLLWFWWSCDRESEVKEFTAAAAEKPHSLRVLLRCPISLVRSTEGNYEQISHYWSKIVDLEDLVRRASLLVSEDSSPEDRELAIRFLKAVEVGKKDRF